MTLGAIIDAGVNLSDIQAGLNSLGLPSCRLVTTEVKKKGFRATSLTVEHEPEHAHRHLHHITEMIDASSLTDRQKDLAKRIFTRLGEAEAKVHGTTIRKVHFHEVGAVDSIADIVGCAIGLDLLRVDKITCSPIPTGQGTIEIAHGRVSIPAPATAELLTGIPLVSSTVEAELTTPTGAAIVATLAEEFGPIPPMTIETIGYGAGDRDLDEQPNILRLIIGKTDNRNASDQIWVLETNLDDVSGEVIGHCVNRLLDAGALDVYTTAIQMKKNRPGVTLSVLCDADRVNSIEQIVFQETSTLGIRRWQAARHKLVRREVSVATPWGKVTGKLAELGDGKLSFAPEYESCRAIAETQHLALEQVFNAARIAFAQTESDHGTTR